MKHLSIFFEHISNALGTCLAIYSWRDGLEIFILASLIYCFARWLNKDKSKQPIYAFFSYTCLTLTTYYMHLDVLSTLLLLAAPIIIVLLIIAHEDILQRNIIPYKTIKPSYEHNYLWLDELSRGCLSALNKQKEIICVVEHIDHIDNFMEADYYLNADLKKELLEILFDYNNINNQGMLWIGPEGKIKAINARIKFASHDMSHDNSLHDVIMASDTADLPRWKRDALLLSSKTDAIIVKMSPQTRLCDCIIKGNIVEDLTTAHCLTLLKRHLSIISNSDKDDYFYANKKSHFFESQST